MNARKILTAAALLLWASSSLAGISIDSDSLTIIDRGWVSEFTGSVRIRGEHFSVDSDRAVSDRRTGEITAYGNVHIAYSSGTHHMQGWCGESRIDDEAKKFYLFNDVKTVFNTEEGQRAVTYADSVEVSYTVPGTAVYTGSVRAEIEEMLITADKAVYSEEENSVVFTGNPSGRSVSEGTRSEYSGDVIRVFLEDEKVNIEGGAKTRVWIEDEPQM